MASASRGEKAKRAALSVGLVLAALVLGCGAMLRWTPDELASAPSACSAASPTDVRVVTFNALHLREERRVGPFVDAVLRTATALDSTPRPPELVSVQEIESDEAADALRARLDAEGYAPLLCDCAPGHRVAAAALRSRFHVDSSDCVSLGSIFPDHPRCFVRVRLEDRASGTPLTFVAIHAAWHLENAYNADDLLEAVPPAERARTIVAGDLNSDDDWPLRLRLEAGGFDDAGRGDGASHATGWRLDAVLFGSGFEAACRTRSDETFAWAHPTVGNAVRCDDEGCTLSDHLPVGARLRRR